MAKPDPSKDKDSSFLKTLWQIASTFLGGVPPLALQLQKNVERRVGRYAQAVEQRVMIMVFQGSTLFISVLFVGFGLLFVLMDNGGVSRGIACLCCGLLGALALLVSLQFKNKSEAL